MSCGVGKAAAASFSNPYIASPTSSSFCNSSAALPTSFYSPSVASPTSQTLHLLHSSFYNLSVASPTSQVGPTSPTSQLILQPYRLFTYVTDHSTTLRCFTYVAGTSRTSPGEPPMRRRMKKQSVVDQLVTAGYGIQKQLQFWMVVKNFTTSSKLIFLQ